MVLLVLPNSTVAILVQIQESAFTQIQESAFTLRQKNITPEISDRPPFLFNVGSIVCLNGRGQGNGPRDSSNCLLEWAGPGEWAKVFKQLFA